MLRLLWLLVVVGGAPTASYFNPFSSHADSPRISEHLRVHTCDAPKHLLPVYVQQNFPGAIGAGANNLLNLQTALLHRNRAQTAAGFLSRMLFSATPSLLHSYNPTTFCLASQFVYITIPCQRVVPLKSGNPCGWQLPGPCLSRCAGAGRGPPCPSETRWRWCRPIANGQGVGGVPQHEPCF